MKKLKNVTKEMKKDRKIKVVFQKRNKKTKKSYTNREYKDRLFKFIFKDKEKLLSLYNTLNSTNYTNPEDIEITTLEDVIYCKMKNDISFIIDDRLSLFEHQSSFNPNMPLRGFFYFSKHFEKFVEENDVDIYGEKLIELPTPKFVVFYNGTGMKEDQMVLRLSEAFTKEKEKACMELEAVVLNINFGKNKELMKSCRPLMEYATFVQKVKDYSKIYERDEAIEFVVKDCIQEDILKDILIKNRAEVVDMLLTEYDEEKRIRIMKNELEEARLEAQEAKQQTQRAEQQAQKAEQQAQKAEQQAQKAKQQAQKAEQQAQMAEQREKETRQLLDKILQERPELAKILESEIKNGKTN